MIFSEKDRQIVCELAKQVVEVASLPIQAEKRTLWTKLNSLERVRPLVWINEIPWHELQSEELQCQTEDPFCRSIERNLRTTLYLWNHMRADMVVDPVFYSSVIYHDTGHGVDVKSVRGRCDERIQIPQITADWGATDRNYQMTCDLLGDIMGVGKRLRRISMSPRADIEKGE